MPTAIRKAVFPAAGLGTRFLPATKAQPKEMLPLVDKPTIQYGVEEAVASGVSNIILVTGRGKNAIEDHFDVSTELETFLESRGKTEQLEEIRKISSMINVSYVRQGEPLGLGHAVLVTEALVAGEPFAVILGDDVIDAEPPALRETPRDKSGEIQLTNGLRRLLQTRPIYAYEIDGVRHDTGNKLGFLKAVVYFAMKRPDLAEPFREYLDSLNLISSGKR